VQYLQWGETLVSRDNKKPIGLKTIATAGFQAIGFLRIVINNAKMNIIEQNIFVWSWKMKEDKKITLPKELQVQMIKFFLKTSIPRKKKEEANLLSEYEADRGGQE